MDSGIGGDMGSDDHGSGRRVEMFATRRLGNIHPGDDLARCLVDAFRQDGREFATGDILVIAQKIVSKSEGRLVHLGTVVPSQRAKDLAVTCHKDPRVIELVLRESREVLRCRPGVIIVETHHGVVLANAGIDRSNIEQIAGDEWVLLLPENPDASCSALRQKIAETTGAQSGVITNDSLGRAWRNGTLGTAIGVSGVLALQDLRGQPDLFGYALQTTEVGTADEIAAAASLLMGQGAEGTPAVLISGLGSFLGDGVARDLVRKREGDLFR
jgi:coenzyme F420-0:L-glutamate ligase/coenzyme F420-1:gamma-L-glutamate ligase